MFPVNLLLLIPLSVVTGYITKGSENDKHPTHVQVFQIGEFAQAIDVSSEFVILNGPEHAHRVHPEGYEKGE